MQVKAKLNNLRVAPRKTRLVAGLIKGLDVEVALNQLDMVVKRSSPQFRKLLESAISNGENNFGLDKSNLYVLDVIVGAGTTLKRWMPKAYGRAGQIWKRTSKIEIILEERVEGKGRKTKEQLEKEKQERIEANRKAEKEKIESAEEGAKKEEFEKSERTVEKKAAGKKKEGNKSGIVNKIFRRKSM